jgi:hypothetical protein
LAAVTCSNHRRLRPVWLQRHLEHGRVEERSGTVRCRVLSKVPRTPRTAIDGIVEEHESTGGGTVAGPVCIVTEVQIELPSISPVFPL